MRLFPQDGARKKTTKYEKHRKSTACGEKPQNTLNILKEGLRKALHVGIYRVGSFPTATGWLIHAGRGTAGAA